MFASMKALLAAILVSGASLVTAEAVKTNVLFVAVDDLKPAIGCYGDKLANTPNIDRIAAMGTLFERAYCMQALCSPSRNALLTGLRPEVLRIYDLGTNFRKSVPEVETLPQWFKQHGYASHGIGKIFHVGHGNHEDAASWSVPHFQAKTVGYALPENRAKLTREEALFSNTDGDVSKLPRGAAHESADVSDDSYADGQIANEGIKRLKEFKKSGTPFFLAVGFLRPHLPFCAPKKYWDLYDPSSFALAERTTPPEGAPEFAPQFGGELRQYAGIPEKGPMPEDLQRKLIHGYYAATSYMDAQLGRLLDELEELGLAENTIVILWGDHGWHLGDHGMWCKHTNYEQATHAPLLISAPGRRSPQRTGALVEFVDIYPTLCDLAGLTKPAHLQGESLVPILDSPGLKRTAAYQVYPRNPKEIGPLLGQAVRTDRWRYVEWRKADGTAVARELYDMENDPQETVNVADRRDKSDVVNEHAALLKARLGIPAPAGLKLLDPAAGKPAAKVDREALFAKKDKDGDGKLTREEFLANQPDPDEAPKRFVRFDTDKDGLLTRDEFVAAGAKR
jgi:iduronate 2-sulfatase